MMSRTMSGLSRWRSSALRSRQHWLRPPQRASHVTGASSSSPSVPVALPGALLLLMSGACSSLAAAVLVLQIEARSAAGFLARGGRRAEEAPEAQAALASAPQEQLSQAMGRCGM